MTEEPSRGGPRGVVRATRQYLGALVNLQSTRVRLHTIETELTRLTAEVNDRVIPLEERVKLLEFLGEGREAQSRVAALASQLESVPVSLRELTLRVAAIEQKMSPEA